MMEQFGVDGIEGYEFLCNRQNRTCPLCNKTEDEILHEAAENRKRKGLPPAKYPMPAGCRIAEVTWIESAGRTDKVRAEEGAEARTGQPVTC